MYSIYKLSDYIDINHPVITLKNLYYIFMMAIDALMMVLYIFMMVIGAFMMEF
jgi:uncharacterized membrane protein